MSQKPIMNELDKVPAEKLVLWMMRLCSVCRLCWNYMDTVCNICATEKRDGTKHLVREIRTNQRGYETFRQFDMTDEQTAIEEDRSWCFEEMFAKDFKRLNAIISRGAEKFSLKGEERMFFIAVHQALALADVVTKYGEWCDERLVSYGVRRIGRCMMVQSELLRAMKVLPCFLPKEMLEIEGRERCITDIANRIHIFGSLITDKETKTETK